MTTCRWCGVDLDRAVVDPVHDVLVPAIRARVWNGREECASVDECERRRVQRQIQVAIERRCD